MQAISPSTFLLAFLLVWGVSRGAEITYTPNETDAQTLHLWHLDEANTPFEDSAKPPTPLLGMHNGAAAGLPSFPGLGNAISFRPAPGLPSSSELAGPVITTSPVLDSGGDDNTEAGFRYFGHDGSFTYEMIVKLDVLPRESASIALGLMTMEGDGEDRIFIFRIEKEGFLSFFPLPHSGATGGGVATIPTSGPHAVDTENWFHIAVTYDGSRNTTNNLKLYWTRIGEEVPAANCIGSGTLSSNFNGRLGDFAIGNEARSFSNNNEAEPFPGKIDEVRISGVARHPSDYFFIPPQLRLGPEQAAKGQGQTHRPASSKLMLSGVFVNMEKIILPKEPQGVLELQSGLHRLDFDFGFSPDQSDGDVKLRCLLEGLDERWRETELGMTFACQTLDLEGKVISQSRFQAVGRSNGWESSLEESAMTRRSEPVFIPPGTHKLRISIGSGSPDTTGFFAIDNIMLHAPGIQSEPLWQSGGYSYNAITTSPAGYLPGWTRGGSEPAIARLIIRPNNPALGLVDGDQFRDAEWSTVQDLDPEVRRGGTFVLSWEEVYNVIDGDTHRATYINVPPGKYTFRAIGLAGYAASTVDGVALPILINPPVWEQLWFWPVLATTIAGLVSAGILHQIRQRTKRRLERLQDQNALEIDRTRIARDMHDDLGTRITVINMTASLAERDLEISPEKARRHLSKMTRSARELVVAMDDLVWAVDPAHDTLDDLAAHLTRLADEMFRDSPVRCRLDIPPVLPELPLGSEFRHNVALATKESLHNVLQHAGPCEVFLKLAFNGEHIAITIRDTGSGFESDGSRGHGLDNLSRRLKEIGGTCDIESIPGKGTKVVLSCRLPERPR